MASVKLVRPGEDILIVTDDGTMIRVAVEHISQYGRSSQGVRVMRLAAGSRVIDMEKTEREEVTEPTEAEMTAEAPEEEPENE